jgi:hypothetical protein
MGLPHHIRQGELPMTTIPHLATTMQTVLGDEAERIARETGLVQRTSKLTGAKFVQTLVWGWLANADSTLEELAQMAINVGVPISPQGLDERFSPQAAACLAGVLAVAVQQLLVADEGPPTLLQRFTGVYVLDSTTLALPAALAEVWAGCGNGQGGSGAALKVQVRWELRRGTLEGPLLQPGRAHDRRSPLQEAPLPRGALRLADLGYFNLALLADLDRQGVYWISRLQSGTLVYDAQGQQVDLAQLLAAQPETRVDLAVRVGQRQDLACRLVAQRVSAEVVEERRRRLHAEARRRGQTVSAARLRLAEWVFYITNAPLSLLAAAEVLVLARLRWQVELLFKLWKSHGQVDACRSHKQWRILCEIYAKLLAMLVQHWVFLCACWRYPNRSLVKAAQTVAKYAFALAAVFQDHAALGDMLARIANCLAHGCRMNVRRKEPNSYQLLLACAEGGLA